jgi:sulfonate transport system ATP-binding protein
VTTSATVGVRLEGVCFEYPRTGVAVVDDFSIEIATGKVVGIVGPSGCGKSTLLSMIAGLNVPTAGRVEWGDRELGARESSHLLAMVFQKDTLLPWMTVRDNVGLHFKLKRRQRSRKDVNARIDELIELAGLGDAGHKYPYQLSGGMRRRVQFLAAVAPQPSVLLLDEPFSSLDEPTRVALHQDVFRIVRALGTTVVLVTHDLAEAVALSDEVAVLTSRPTRIYERVAVPFGDERNMFELRQTNEFLSLYGTLWSKLSLQIQRQMAAAA